MINYFPKYFTNRAIILYLVLLLFCYIVFQQPLPVLWAIFGLIEVIGFFGFTNGLTRKWSQITQKTFERRLFGSALTIRIAWVLISYIFFNYMTGKPFEFNAVDSLWYHFRASSITANPFSYFLEAQLTDSGYMVYLSIIYKIFGNFVLIPRLIKVLISSYTCVLIYKLASRNFGDATGRISGIMAMLLPNFIYYCGLHLRETEMVFLLVWFAERADLFLRMRRFSFKKIIMPIFLAASLFVFRNLLSAVALLSFFGAMMFSSKRLIDWNKRLAAILIIFIIVGFLFRGRIAMEVNQRWQARETSQTNSMIARAERKEGGNAFAKYGNEAVFIPIIIPAPFPTLVNVQGHENQMLLNGGYFVRNIYSFFVFLAIFLLFKRKLIKDHILILFLLFGYLLILAFSGFAIAERFHMPAVPFLIILTGYGINQLKRNNLKYYNLYLLLMAILIIGWNWFKLAGRGLI